MKKTGKPDLLGIIISPEEKNRADKLIVEAAEGKSIESGENQRFLNRADIRMYVEQGLNKAGLTDNWIYERLQLLANTGTSGENLATTKPAIALQALRTVLELKDRFPSIRVQQESTKVEVSLKASNLNELREMLGSLHQKTEKFLKITDSKAKQAK